MIDIAVVGCGYWGPNLIRNFNSLPECEVKIVCDSSIERLEYIGNLYPSILITNKFDDVTNDPDIDAVVIATPTKTHFELSKKSLLAGKHTFIEKPMTQTYYEGLILNDIANRYKLTLMVGHTFIYSSPVRKIKEIIAKKELGDILYISSRRLNLGLFQKDINVAWDLAPHDISIILYVLDEVPLSVSCLGKSSYSGNTEEVTNITLNLSNNIFSTIQSSWLDPNKVREMTFVGTEQMLVYNDLEPMEKIKIYDTRVDELSYHDTFAEFHYSYHYGGTHSPYLEQYEPLKVECQHFLDCVKSGKRPDSSGIEGLQVIKVLEAASKSLIQRGIEIEI